MRRGTQEPALFQADALRKRQKEIKAADRAAGQRPGQSLIDWDNRTVGPTLLRQSGERTAGWILDCTKLLGNLSNGSNKASPASKGEDGTPSRGYKLALLLSLVDEGWRIMRLGWDDGLAGDHPVARPLAQAEAPRARGDTLRHDRGLIEGATPSRHRDSLGRFRRWKRWTPIPPGPSDS